MPLLDLPHCMAIHVAGFLRIDDVGRLGFASRAAASAMLNHGVDTDADAPRPADDLWVDMYRRDSSQSGWRTTVPENPKERLLDEIGQSIESRHREMSRLYLCRTRTPAI